jgi:GTP-binding protein LepA
MLNGETEHIRSASELTDMSRVETIEEPWIKGEVVVPKKYVGAVITLIATSRGRQTSIDYIDDELSIVYFEAPLANMLTDFFDSLKGATSGYGSYSYELSGYRIEDLVKLDFLVASERVDSLSAIVHKSEAEKLGRSTVKKLKDLIPKQLFKVSLQAAIGSRIIAREDIPALKKNVTAHLYGGDVSRKKKLWAKQKRGKERMKKFGNVEIPPEAFTALIRRD